MSMSSIIQSAKIVGRTTKNLCCQKSYKLLTLLMGFVVFIFVSLHKYQVNYTADLKTRGCEVLGFESNNFGDNDNVCVDPSRHKDTPPEKLKTILMWNLAYGTKEYGIGFGRDTFYRHKCPETRCYSTSNRTYLKDVGDFDAILFHQRSFDFEDLPETRKQHQRYIHWIVESAQYLYMDISKLNGIFNWTMTYRRDSDFYLPYGRFHKIKSHPEGEELERYIKEFGWKNRHLAKTGNPQNRTHLQAAWFVSHCATVARREKYVKAMQQHMDVHVYGKCSHGYSKRTCGREKEMDCYKMMDQNYKFYLSFENSICDDYLTEKYFNIFRYNVIPLSYSGGNFTAISPPHSSINVLQYPSPKTLVKYLEKLNANDNLFAEYFWWRDFYVVRNSPEDMNQAYCDLCAKLNNPNEPPKVYQDMQKWWVAKSHCKKIKSSYLNSD